MSILKYNYESKGNFILLVYDDYIVIKIKGLFNSIVEEHIFHYNEFVSLEIIDFPTSLGAGHLRINKPDFKFITGKNTCVFNNPDNIKEIVNYVNSKVSYVPKSSNFQSKDISQPQPTNINSSSQQNIPEGLVYSFDGGSGDILEVYENYIIIKHKGLLNALSMGLKGDKTIYYSDISAIEFKEPGMFTSGMIQFSILGGNENIGGYLSAHTDENTIIFTNNVPYAKQIRDYINNRIKEIKTNKNNQVVQQAFSAADEIKKFKDLLDVGVISQEEFEAKKKQLLGL